MVVAILVITTLIFLFLPEKGDNIESNPKIIFRQTDTSDIIDALGDVLYLKKNHISTGITKDAIVKANSISIQKELSKMDAKTASRLMNFANAILNNSSLADIYQAYLNNRAPAYIPELKEFMGEFPQYNEKEATFFLNYCQKLFKKYQNGDFDPKDVTYHMFPNTEAHKSYKYPKFRYTLISEEELILKEMLDKNK